MSQLQTLRAVVTERLTAAAEDIFALFERTIAEYEEELRHFIDENQRKQWLLDSVCDPRIELPGAGTEASFSPSPGPSLNQNISRIKQEPKALEEEQRILFVQDTSAVCLNTAESSLFEEQTELKEETQEDVRSEPHLHSDPEEHTAHSSDFDNNKWKPPLSWLNPPMETEPDGGNYNQVQTRDRSTAAQTSEMSSELTSDTSATVRKRGKRNFQCSFCLKRFNCNRDLQIHIRTHTGERPFTCSVCGKSFNHKATLDNHKIIHTGERPFHCSVCEKTFNRKCTLEKHKRIHTGERPFKCPICEKTFSHNWYLKVHLRIHSNKKPYGCPHCEKSFNQKIHLEKHQLTCVFERPLS